jgi:5'-nucleotidase
MNSSNSRVPNDLALAKAVNALSSSGQKGKDISNEHGADLLLGGHDHLYFVSKGVDAWENYDLKQTVLGAEADDGSVLVIKVTIHISSEDYTLIYVILEWN